MKRFAKQMHCAKSLQGGGQYLICLEQNFQGPNQHCYTKPMNYLVSIKSSFNAFFAVRVLEEVIERL